MKLKKEPILTIIISIILINIPAQIFAWGMPIKTTYEVCNMINTCIAGTLRIVALAIAIIYVISLLKTKKSSEQEEKQKIPKSLILIIIQIVVLLLAAFFVTQIGMQTRIYGEEYQVFEFPDIIRIIAFVAIIFCIIKAIIYYVSSEEENKQKIINQKNELINKLLRIKKNSVSKEDYLNLRNEWNKKREETKDERN